MRSSLQSHYETFMRNKYRLLALALASFIAMC